MNPEISKCFHSSGITLSLSSVNNQNLTNILKFVLIFAVFGIRKGWLGTLNNEVID